MARSLLVGLTLCALVLVGASAEAGLRRGGCKGGSCGVSYSGCANGSCSVQAPVQGPVQKTSPSDVPPAPSADVKPADQPAVAVEASTPATTVAVNSTRNFRSGRLFSRRAR